MDANTTQTTAEMDSQRELDREEYRALRRAQGGKDWEGEYGPLPGWTQERVDEVFCLAP